MTDENTRGERRYQAAEIPRKEEFKVSVKYYYEDDELPPETHFRDIKYVHPEVAVEAIRERYSVWAKIEEKWNDEVELVKAEVLDSGEEVELKLETAIKLEGWGYVEITTESKEIDKRRTARRLREATSMGVS